MKTFMPILCCFGLLIGGSLLTAPQEKINASTPAERQIEDPVKKPAPNANNSVYSDGAQEVVVGRRVFFRRARLMTMVPAESIPVQTVQTVQVESGVFAVMASSGSRVFGAVRSLLGFDRRQARREARRSI